MIDATVTCVLMNHPVLTYGYRVDCGGKSLFFSGDHEQPYNIYEPEDTYHGEYDMLMADKIARIAEVAKDVDPLVQNAYTPFEIIEGPQGPLRPVFRVFRVF